jgi:hypothetical protein
MCFERNLGFLLFLALAAYGQERIAIIQTLDDRDSIGISELVYLTDRLRETAVNVLPKSRYGVMTTESIIAFLGTQERAAKECSEASCLAELGRKVNAGYVAQARVGRFGESLTIKAELYSSKSGDLVGSFIGDAKDIFGLLAIIDEKSPALFKKMPGAEDGASICEEKKEPEKRIRFGARANFGVVDNDGHDEGGGGFGTFVAIPLFGIYLVPEISLQFREVGDYSPENNIVIEEEEKIIDISLLFRFRYREENIIHIGIGPFFGIVLNMEELDGAFKDYYRSKIEYGILLELGAHIFRTGLLFASDLPIDFRFGFIDTSKDKFHFESIVQFGVSYVF